MEKIIKFIKSPIFILSIIYFIFRSINLNSIGSFTDESIYLDWAYRMVTVPGLLFYSLYDAKTPLYLWIFGAAILINKSDPLFSARLVSVIFGFITMLGIYRICIRYIDLKSSIFAVVLYIFTPLFVFYDRQALMESGISAIGIWSLYFSLRFWDKKKTKYLIYLGIIFGVGYLIKSNSIIFMLSFLFLSMFFGIKNRNFKFIKHISILVLVFLATTSLIYLQPDYWKSLTTNSRYVLSLGEIIRIPLVIWLNNFKNNFYVIAVYVGILTLIGSFIGTYFIYKDKSKLKKAIFFVAMVLIIQIIFTRGSNQRYIVSYLPALIVFCSYLIKKTFDSSHYRGYVLTVFFLVPSIILSLFLIFNPEKYFIFTDRISKESNYSTYITGSLSGNGLSNLKNTLIDLSAGRQIMVATAINIGNPESYLNVAFLKNKNIQTGYMESSSFGDRLSNVDCLDSDLNIYFVSRDDQLAGLNKYFTKIDSINITDGKSYYGIWELNKDCVGITEKINMERVL